MERLQELARVLVDDAALAAWAGGDGDRRGLWDLAVREDVHCLLAWRVLVDGEGLCADARRREARAALAGATALEALQRRELARLTTAFARHGIRALLLKGAAWAYTVYPDPALRPRLDSDVLIDVTARGPVEHLLLSIGYEPAVENVMELASAQRHYRRVDDWRVVHALDVHWRVANPLVFADALPFAHLWDRSVGVARLGEARTLCAADALLLACLHRVAHHGHLSSLLWLLDVHLLAGALSAEQWDDLVREADASGLRGICAQGLSRAIEWFGTRVPEDVRAWLGGSETPEAVFLGRGVSPLGVLISDWRAVATWAGRLRLIGDHVCPPPSYMLARYGSRHRILLPFLYGQRAIGGLCRWAARGWRTLPPRRAFWRVGAKLRLRR